jgi:hypothetical protein
MSTQQLSTVTYDLIESYGNTAKNVIHAYRVGGERVAGLLEQRWNVAFEQSLPQLSAETAANAAAAKQLVGGYYAKGLSVTTDGATDMVAQLVRLAGSGVERAASNANLFETKTGVTALNSLAQATLPGVVALSTLAAQMEQKSAVLARKIKGDSVLNVAKRASALRKKRTAKAA